MEDDEAHGSQFSAYLCPNPGSSTNMGAKRQRLIFQEIDRNDVYSALDVAKSADIVLVVMSARACNVGGISRDPYAESNAIDETGYKTLHLLRSQGIPSLIGVLQHIEGVSSSRQT